MPRLEWRCPQLWPGETVFIVAGGPSLLDVDLECLVGRPVIAINKAYRLVPWAEFLFFNDGWFWNENRAEILKFPGQIVTPWTRAIHPRVHVMRRTGSRGIDGNPSCLRSGGTSVLGGSNLAAHLIGWGRIVLLGVDMKFAVNGRTHWHEGHSVQAVPEQFPYMIRALESMKKPLKKMGIRVFNATEGSALDCFTKVPLSRFL